jgi:hypothetical protein
MDHRERSIEVLNAGRRAPRSPRRAAGFVPGDAVGAWLMESVKLGVEGHTKGEKCR